MNANIVGLLDQAAARYGVDPNLAVSVAQQESSGNPNAVSSAGAQGVMQLMPATAVSLGVSNPFDPAQNIDAGVRFLSQLISQFGGDVQLGLAAYDWGPGNVSKYGYSNWPAETVNYVSSILNRIGASFTPPSATAAAPAALPVSPSVFDPATLDPAATMQLGQPEAMTPAENVGAMVAIGLIGLIAYLAWS